jgi:regulator of protease activity HflC (stomatin/prohibitin superfamily)
MNQITYMAFIIGITLTGLLLMIAAVRKIPDEHRGVLFRFGRLVRELPAGTAWVWPLIDQVMLVDLREQAFPLPANLTYAADSESYFVKGDFTCQVMAPIPAVMAAMQARQDVADAVGKIVLVELNKMGRAFANDQPAQAQERMLAVLNEQMSRAWQLRFTKVEFRLSQLASTD